MDKTILEYYDRFEEHKRILGDSIERMRTEELVSRYLTASPWEILDVGGGAGVYSFWLSSLGHHVHLVDASEKHVQQAKEISATTGDTLSAIEVGDARSLRFDGESFDAVLMLGPLYHLTDRTERIQALREVKRVMKPGAVIFAAAISRYASLIDGLLYDRIADLDYVSIMMQDLKDGQHRDTAGKDYFTTAFFHLPEELKSEMADSGFAAIELFAIEGISEMLPDLAEKMAEDRYRSILLDVIRSTEQDSAFMGMSAHILGVGKKK